MISPKYAWVKAKNKKKAKSEKDKEFFTYNITYTNILLILLILTNAPTEANVLINLAICLGWFFRS